ncbi:hypothetical protein OFN32_36650, partial [Escherichia coli]|nr:hypothetical protein [Escherichia coli]
ATKIARVKKNTPRLNFEAFLFQFESTVSPCNATFAIQGVLFGVSWDENRLAFIYYTRFTICVCNHERGI